MYIRIACVSISARCLTHHNAFPAPRCSSGTRSAISYVAFGREHPSSETDGRGVKAASFDIASLAYGDVRPAGRTLS